MRRIVTLIFIILNFVKINAQNQRFIYEYSFKPDSLNKQNTLKEIMNLDVTKEGSIFYSQLLLDRDSLFHQQFEKGKLSGNINIDLRKIKKSQANFIISKKYPNFDTEFHTSFNALNLVIKGNSKINWKITPETNTIEGFSVQKATTNFGGRNWIAWYTNEIPIQDGPYKFNSLPGLILMIADDKDEHIFKLVGSKKQNYKSFELKNLGKEIEVTERKFNDLWNEYKRDPAKNIKLIHGSSEMSETIFYDSNTKSPLTKQDLIRNKEEGDKKYFKYYNNYIERNLYK